MTSLIKMTDGKMNKSFYANTHANGINMNSVKHEGVRVASTTFSFSLSNNQI